MAPVHEQFLRTAIEFELAILAYCFMPDHVHHVVEGRTDSADLRAFVALAKQRAAFMAHPQLGARLWQKGYFERVLRDGDDVFDVARYVIQNPVRAGLVLSPGEYRFMGSSILTTEQLIESCAWKPRERARSRHP